MLPTVVPIDSLRIPSSIHRDQDELNAVDKVVHPCPCVWLTWVVALANTRGSVPIP